MVTAIYLKSVQVEKGVNLLFVAVPFSQQCPIDAVLAYNPMSLPLSCISAAGVGLAGLGSRSRSGLHFVPYVSFFSFF